MAHIRIEEVATKPQESAEQRSWQARLIFAGGQYPLTISDPFTPEEEQRLQWYFEEHLRLPFMNTVKAQEVARSITTYGTRLFEQVFGAPEHYAHYQKAVGEGLHRLEIEIAGSPAFQQLHWEAMMNSRASQHPLSLHACFLRKHTGTVPLYTGKVQPSPTINLLLVTARPDGRNDVGYRTISRPLVEALRQTNIPVQIEIVRPGTYEALHTHLESVTRSKGLGYYHIIHFDLHGAVYTYEQFQRQKNEGNRFAFNSRYGRNDMQPFEGRRGFLFFEGREEGQADPAEAGEVADLLHLHAIPICILNACQSGQEGGSSESSLGYRLMQAGVQLVLAMRYSVTVSAASLLMQTLYERLFAHEGVTTAISHGRLALYNRKARRAYYNMHIDLEDWLLPIVYQNQPVQLTTRPFSDEESITYYTQRASRYQPLEPAYGFVGRDLDILQIEKRLLTRNTILLIQGMGGAGKSTLLRHLGHWWQETGFVEKVFYFGYDEKAWTRTHILNALAKELFDDKTYRYGFQPLQIEAKQAMVVQQLRGTRHLLILDNLESVTGEYLAIQHTLSRKEQSAMQSLLRDLKGGRTLVLLGSRSREDWLQKGICEENIYLLPGLDQEATSTLAERILERHLDPRQVKTYRADKEFTHLLKLLDGFPLALEVVLANFKSQTPRQVLTALQEGNVSLDRGNAQDKTESILRCIDYSHSNLAPDMQQLLLCLAPFISVIYTDDIDSYVERLKEQEALKDWPFEQWETLIAEIRNRGLLSPDPELEGYLRLHPTLPYFLRGRWQEPGMAEVRKAIETAFREYYDNVGDALSDLMWSQKPEERQRGQVLAKREYENLLSALRLALAAQVFILNIYLCLHTYLDTTQEHERGLYLAEEVLQQLEAYPAEVLQAEMGYELFHMKDRLGGRQFSLKRYAEAQTSYQSALEDWQRNTHYDTETRRKESAGVYHRLGMVATNQRKWEEAERYYQQALQIKIEYDDRYSQASTYHQLGRVAEEQRKWEEAEGYYQQSLQIEIEYNDRYNQALTYYCLGRMQVEQERWEQARTYQMQALGIFIKYKDEGYQEGALYWLARVWRDGQDESVPKEVAEVMEMEEIEEAVALLQQMLDKFEGNEEGEDEDNGDDRDDEEGEEKMMAPVSTGEPHGLRKLWGWIRGRG